jgi:hypothetical protein
VDALRVVVDCDLGVGLLDLSCAAGGIKAKNLVVALAGSLGGCVVWSHNGKRVPICDELLSVGVVVKRALRYLGEGTRGRDIVMGM